MVPLDVVLYDQWSKLIHLLPPDSRTTELARLDTILTTSGAFAPCCACNTISVFKAQTPVNVMHMFTMPPGPFGICVCLVALYHLSALLKCTQQCLS